MPLIDMAERAGVRIDGGVRANEDQIVVLPHAVVLLDGATTLQPRARSGGWYAECLGDYLRRGLNKDPEADLAEVLETAIGTMAEDYDLKPGSSPSSTVAIVRWTDDHVDALVLADSPVVAFTIGDVHVVNDTRLANLPRPTSSHREHLREGRGYGEEHLELLRSSAAEVAAWRNREGGFWVAEADPAAARQAIRAGWPRDQVQSVVMASDGVSCGVDDYGLFADWTALLDQASDEGLHAVLDAVRKAEASDPDGKRWPRPKLHDDQALVLIHFDDDWLPDFLR
ncbi:protein phosphatase 2C domain-containing protein [Allokutzneria albata]|nr:protein phosphatase 2C domain-containing protein [Allokutzneria albata]